MVLDAALMFIRIVHEGLQTGSPVLGLLLALLASSMVLVSADAETLARQTVVLQAHIHLDD